MPKKEWGCEKEKRRKISPFVEMNRWKEMIRLNVNELNGFSTNIIKPFNVTNAQENYASAFYERIIKMINEFEQELDQNQEVGLRLVSFGQTVQFHIQELGYFNPSLIKFIGTMDNGSKVELVQHVSQISFLLMALPKLNEDKPARRLGFVANDDE